LFSHQAVDVLDNQSFTGVFLLERVDLNVIDGASLDFVSVALIENELDKIIQRTHQVTHFIRSMMAFKCRVRSKRLILNKEDSHKYLKTQSNFTPNLSPSTFQRESASNRRDLSKPSSLDKVVR
jgi:hypothetical protein